MTKREMQVNAPRCVLRAPGCEQIPPSPLCERGVRGDYVKREARGAKREAGFTLIELLVVMFILGLLAALVVPKYVGHIGGSKQKAAQAQIELFGTALDTFRLDVGRYPTTEEGLEALRKAPSNVSNWHGPYLPREIPKDPWDNAYVYKNPGEHGEYDLIAYGADKAPGGEGENKDIVSWKGLGQ